MKIGDEVFIHGYVDEIRKDTVIIRNDGGYFGTVESEISTPKIGRWVEVAKYSDGKHKIECSECGNYIFDRGHANSQNVKDKYKYCPNCGAKMEEADNGRQ